MTTFTNYSDYQAALKAGQRDIKFNSLTESSVKTTNGISSHLKHTLAAIQNNELYGAA
jgi:hypothetical protein